jgi:hypothetical protein
MAANDSFNWLKGLLGTGAAANAGTDTQLYQLYLHERIQRESNGEAMPPYEEWAKQFGVMNAGQPYKANK